MMMMMMGSPPLHPHLPNARRRLVVPNPSCSSTKPSPFQCLSSSSSSSNFKVVVGGPPEDFDFRAETRERTARIVEDLFPRLADLARDGTLVAVERPRCYVERRTDGYAEPQMVFLVGTAHMSQTSAAQVERVIKTIRPENVIVELCRSRAGIMYETPDELNIEGDNTLLKSKSNLMSISGENLWATVWRSLLLGGRSAMALRLLLAGVSLRLSSSTGVQTGEEFRAARKAAEDIGAQLVLGDRPIEITLQRSWQALNFIEKMKLGWVLLQGTRNSTLDVSEETLEFLKRDDTLSAMFRELSHQFPSLVQPLIHERDRYLAWSLKRSKAVNGSSIVVGVVGCGHMRGLVYALKHDQQDLRFRDLVGPRGNSSDREKKRTQNVLRNLVVEALIGVILWLVYDYYTRT